MNAQLNLARKWRPKNFETIVGQDVSVSMLKNGLYQEKLFPVYLFSGQRGCGKTSTARVFAAAVNCLDQEQFRQSPKEHPIPCLQCDSCKAMTKGEHPDFIEIDAASHTGVEHVRQLIESCSYMPLSGRKKIYLIDEAHMLSRAAFNAFLKVLEEPPPSIMFILATTEMHKIPETVRSRCFLTLFNPVTHDILKNHLSAICSKESIAIDTDALSLLIRETDGSVRDAINTLERVRFVGAHITATVVLKTLGKISEVTLFDLFTLVLDQKPRELLTYLKKIHFEELTPQNLWNALVQTCRTLLWFKYGITDIPESWYNDQQALEDLADRCSINRLHALMQILWSQEELFIRTPQKHALLETVLLQMCQQVPIAQLDELIKACKSGTPVKTLRDAPNAKASGCSSGRAGFSTEIQSSSISAIPGESSDQSATSVRPEEPTKLDEAETVSRRVLTNESSPKNTPWSEFLHKIAHVKDPLLVSIFKQAQFVQIDDVQKITLGLNSNSPFFVDKIKECEALWKSIIEEIFENFSGFVFTEKKSLSNTPKAATKAQSTQKTTEDATRKVFSPPKPPPTQQFRPKNSFWQRNAAKNGSPIRRGEHIDVSDAEKWPKANLIVSQFAGTIEKAVETK